MKPLLPECEAMSLAARESTVAYGWEIKNDRTWTFECKVLRPRLRRAVSLILIG